MSTKRSESLRLCRAVRHSIDTKDASPININAYPLLIEKLDEQARQVADLLDKGIIRESSNPWRFSVVFVKKHNDMWRMCIDYRALNKVIP